jgi:phage tail sheath gpL-like
MAGAVNTLSGFTPAAPAAGGKASITLQIKNTGQSAGSFSLTGQTQLNGVTEGSLTTATGTVQPGATAAATVVMAGGIAEQYNAITNPTGIAGTALDVLLTLTETDTGQVVGQFLLPGAILIPAAPTPTPANLQVVGVSVGVAS